MVDYLEILPLSSDPKNSQLCIASIVHCSRHTIRAVWEAAKKASLSWPLDVTVTNEMLKRILFSERTTTEALHTQPLHPQGISTTMCKSYAVMDGILQALRKQRHHAIHVHAVL